MVGCVLVNNASVVGEGWHERAGEPHAEMKMTKACWPQYLYGSINNCPVLFGLHPAELDGYLGIATVKHPRTSFLVFE